MDRVRRLEWSIPEVIAYEVLPGSPVCVQAPRKTISSRYLSRIPEAQKNPHSDPPENMPSNLGKGRDIGLVFSSVRVDQPNATSHGNARLVVHRQLD